MPPLDRHEGRRLMDGMDVTRRAYRATGFATRRRRTDGIWGEIFAFENCFNRFILGILGVALGILRSFIGD